MAQIAYMHPAKFITFVNIQANNKRGWPDFFIYFSPHFPTSGEVTFLPAA
jgi:hypothetical protein